MAKTSMKNKQQKPLSSPQGLIPVALFAEDRTPFFANTEFAESASENWLTKAKSLALRKQVGKMEE